MNRSAAARVATAKAWQGGHLSLSYSPVAAAAAPGGCAMKVRVTIEVSHDDRVAIADYYGEPGAATHHTMRGWMQNEIKATLEGITFEYLERAKAEDR